MKQPVDHILRAQLPWREDAEGAITECGYDASKVTTITREAFFRRQKEFGQQRTAMITCMTCLNTVHRWNTWEEDPRQAIGREVEWERGMGYRPQERGTQLKDELQAIAALIEAHRDEFDASVGEIQARREWLAKKKAMDRRPKPQLRSL
jgi:hypothetical protein